MATRIATGTITNAAGITISGAAYGVEIAGSPAGLTNYGSIVGTSGAGVMLLAGGSVTNATGGTIAGTNYGIHIGGTIGNAADAGTVTNSGLIAGGSNFGVDLYAGGTVTNIGTIAGSVGVRGRYGSSTVDNSGTITGTGGAAVQLNGFQHNRVIDRAGAVFNGTVNGGNGAGRYVSYSTLELAARGNGTLSALGTNFTRFGRVTVDTGANWTVAGANTLAATYVLTNQGTLTNAGTLINNGVVLGIVTLTPGAILSNTGTIHYVLPQGGYNHAVYGRAGGAETVVNAGYIGGTTVVGSATFSSGIDLAGGGSVVNLSGGTIAGSVRTGQQATIGNAGLVTSYIYIATNGASNFGNDGTVTSGVYMVSAGTITNGIHGVIRLSSAISVGQFQNAAIDLGNGGTIVNAGSILSTVGYGVAGIGATSLTNVSGGTIAGTGFGVDFVYTNQVGHNAASAVTNAGTIAGATAAVKLLAGFANRLIVDPGAVFSGIVDGGNAIGGNAVSTLEFASAASAGTLSGLGSHYTGFAQTQIDTGANWTLTGSNTLAAGSVLTNAGTLSLLNASLSGAAAVVNNGAIVIDPSSVTIASLTGTGTTTIAAGSTLDITGTVSAGETIVFTANTGTLAFDPTQFAGQIDGFQAGDTIDLTGVTDATSATIVNSNTLEILRSAHPAIDLTLGANSNLATASFAVTAAGVLTTTAPCFCPGTLIRTDRGDVAVEALAIGDIVVTASGTRRPIQWIGYRHMDLTRHPAPHRAQPIRVRAGAFGFGQPSRNLFLSPEHAVLRDGLLIPIRLLVNGSSIVRETRSAVTYYHIELETHDILLAEDLPVESYLDTGNRGMFSNADVPLHLHPDLTNDMARRFGESCAPFADDPGRVRPIWQEIARRAEQIGMPLAESPPATNDPDLHLIVDGRRINPVRPAERHYLFIVPAGSDRVRLVSRSGFRFDTAPWIADERRMGVQLCALTVRSSGEVKPVALDDPNLDEGWWTPEWHSPTILRRWTDGDAVLPLPVPDNAADIVLLDIELGAPMEYRLPAGDRFNGFDGATDLEPNPPGRTPDLLSQHKQIRRAG